MECGSSTLVFFVVDIALVGQAWGKTTRVYTKTDTGMELEGPHPQRSFFSSLKLFVCRGRVFSPTDAKRHSNVTLHCREKKQTKKLAQSNHTLDIGESEKSAFFLGKKMGTSLFGGSAIIPFLAFLMGGPLRVKGSFCVRFVDRRATKTMKLPDD